MGNDAMQTYTVDVTPEMAKRWLEKHNHRNRSIRWRNVKLLAAEMQKGRFVTNGDPIRFDTNRELLDGQHRLAAIVDSGVTLKNQLVVCNLDPDVMATIDTGAKRKLGDQLKINGVQCSTNIAAAARICVCIEHDDLALSFNHPDSEYYDFARVHESEIRAAVTKSSRIYNAIGGSQAVYTAGLFYAAAYDSEKTEAFIEGVASGEGLKKGDPTLTFRNYALRNYAGGRRGHAPKAYFQLQIFIRALNAQLLGRKISVLRWAENESYQNLFFLATKKEKQDVPGPLADLLKDEEKTPDGE